ncbi:hypothetical protein ISS40_07480 [Candidatus Bathyarchaeota archaeon]|nr:hypothetical protein [Candidatus Bathyarchaeota archaeon]
MAYSSRKIVLFGAAGVVIAALLILVFAPVREEVGVNTMVALQEIPGYGFQVVKMGEGQADVVHLNVTLDGFEARRQDGGWTELTVGSVSFNMLRDREISFNAQAGSLDAGSYTAVRFRVVRGFEDSNATLSNDDVIGVDVPSQKVEIETSPFEVSVDTESLLIDLRIGSGLLSNYMLPDLHLSLGTLKVEIGVSPG